ncbi:exodeoxyribonuclease V subunit alpha [Actinomycetospora cinnamomea]|uniref:RecBCD enzyme subunit RecD n=1 Tax=Actinomycetospora cinnamomea TaxID=663609 RepID=A0A2U1FFX7_9PSEU|nr:exodeoxyribonuclease V subunit alpha [Actinomycetospora cinnamomea]PVZ11072.1 DNA helicase/exodeoxyribonuclease V alpha subunit [Actinomycetospora cinnamomea]
MSVPTATGALLAEDGVRFAVRATGLLAEFNARGVLAATDVQVAHRLGRLGGETDEQVLLAAALTVRALRAGSVCLDLSAVDRTVLAEGDELVDTSDLRWPEPESWTAACAASPLVAADDATATGHPLRLVDGLLYLDRYWRQEEQVRGALATRAAAPPPVVDEARLRAALDRLFRGGPDATDAAQRRAVAVCTLRWISVLAGGPGTGKTTTVATLLAVLRDQDPSLRIALAAPTGKAAARMQEALAEVDLPPGDRERLAGPSASTIHRLLGPIRGSSRFRFDRHRRLPYDVVVVDETSMVSLTLMARLLEAVRPDARLVLVGDPDQLASVEAGAVLGDLVAAPADPEPHLDHALERVGAPGPPVTGGVTVLDRTWRFHGTIAALAAAIRAGDADAAVAALRAGQHDVVFVEDADLTVRDPAGLRALRDEVVGAASETELAALDGDAPLALSRLDEHRLLCAHRRGPFGVTRWAADVERWLLEAGPVADRDEEWYPGRPLLVTANDHDRGVYNGDTGVVIATPKGPRAVFARGNAPIAIAPSLLDAVTTVHAMTVHRAQGSQFARVSVILPPAESPLLTRELLYTAVTRARVTVRLVGSEEAVRAAIARPIGRASGLRRHR